MITDAPSHQWFLKKHDDGTVFGPISFAQLAQWSIEAQVSPLDLVSVDQNTWHRAPMIPDLAMDYLVELGPDTYYGPTTVGALREFFRNGEITFQTIVTNCRDGSATSLRDVPNFRTEDETEEDNSRPLRSSIRFNLQQRIRELEEQLMQERRAREHAEHLVAKLETKLEEITRAAAL